MSDLLIQLHQNRLTAPFVKAIGLPKPVVLTRTNQGYTHKPLYGKVVYLCGSENGYALKTLRERIIEAGGELTYEPHDESINVTVVDATGCVVPEDYRLLFDSFHSIIPQIAKNARVLITAALIEEAEDVIAATVARGIEGFSRSLAKELGPKGITVNLAYVSKNALSGLDGVVNFFCGAQTAYVSGQAITVTTTVPTPSKITKIRVLKEKVALVTGAARGIGLATALRLRQEGANVICLDVPALYDELQQACQKIGARALPLDISSADAAQQLSDFLTHEYDGVDIVVHNAGITRDKTLAKMSATCWDTVININLTSIININRHLFENKILRVDGRVICLSSISGVAGNFGQTNYATSKAALIGYVKAQAPDLAERGISINAVAPGFIETAMTNAMPFATREIGKRLNSIKQGGQPRDVAELITFLSSPNSYGITGNTIRICGQGWIGA
ncbi:3-oxoacyl-ACP reductase [Acinetobacter guillouiae]|uniref:3-oxoacyl-ACP reductase n=1 Tax=Acinetobacter guillouiae TaxID=106649 RepID=UPI002FD8EAFD